MKSNQFHEEQAVSSVIGSIMLFALFVAVMATIQTSYVPVWQEDSEAQHMRQVGDQFSDIRSQLDRQIAGQDSGSVSMPVNLGGNEKAFKFSMFSTINLPSSLEFTSGNAPVSLSATKLVIQGDDKSRNYVLDEDWQTLTNGYRIDDIEEVKHMRIRMLDFTNLQGNAHGKKDDGYLEATVLDSNGAFAGSITITKETVSSDWAINAEVKKADGVIIFNQLLVSAKHDIAPDTYYLNLFENDLFVDAVMGAASVPFDIVWTNQNVPAEIAHTVIAGGVVIGSSGYTVPNYADANVGGTLKFKSESSNLVSQDFVLENGALIADQGDKAGFILEPQLDVQLLGTRTIVDWTLPTLTGGSQTVTGLGNSAVRLSPKTLDSIEAQAPNLIVTLTTAYPTIWSNWLEEELARSTLDDAAGEYSITSTTSSVTLSIYGTTAAPADQSLDINFNFNQRNILVELIP